MRKQWIIGAVLAVASVLAFGWFFKAEIRYRVEHLLGSNRVHWVNKLPYKLKRQGVAHHVILSRVLEHPVGVSVYHPVNFASSQTKSVVYFLHGRGGTEISDVEGVLATILPIFSELNLPEPLVVFPNSGLTAYRAPYDEMFFEELMPQIESLYLPSTTDKKAFKRLIMGFSFGGFGALNFTLREPAKFSGLISLAGGFYASDPEINARIRGIMPTLRENAFAAYFINGEWDRPAVFEPLTRLWASAGINAHRVVLPETPHALPLYLQRSRVPLREFFSSTLEPTGP